MKYHERISVLVNERSKKKHLREDISLDDGNSFIRTESVDLYAIDI
jgi:hypothetical protein